MALEHVPIHLSPGVTQAHLRELTGFDERAVEDLSTASAIRLLEQVAVTAAGAPDSELPVSRLPARERDRLLAAVYRCSFGDGIETTATCARCGSPFEVAFSLRELSASVDAGRERAPELMPDGTFQSGDRRLRLPTGDDECAVAGLPSDEAERRLLQSCVLSGEIEDAAAVQDLFERIAPVLDLDLGARCPECGGAQTVHFDIQSYLLGAVLNARPALVRDAHRLAIAYGWSLHEILSLSRSERRMHVDLVDAELSRRKRW
jgi:hypothetical protein